MEVDSSRRCEAPPTCPGNSEQWAESGISSLTQRECRVRDLTGPASRQELALR